MKLEVQPRDDHQVKIIAEFEQAEFDSYVHRAARKLAKQTRIPGFRPGKAPFDIVRRVIGDEALNQQAIEDLVDDQYGKILDEAKVQPGASGSLDEIVEMNPPKLAFLVPLEPEVVLGDYKSIRQEYQPQEVGDSEVEDFLKRLQTNYSTAEPVERPAEKGDLVYVKFSGKLTNPAEGEDADVFPERPAQFIIGDEVVQDRDWPFPGFNDRLAGLSADETKRILHTFSADDEDEAIRGKEVEFEITVQSIKSMTLPEIDDDFAQTVGQFESVEALRNAVREQLEENKKNEYEDTFFSSLIDKVVADATIKYPPQSLDHETEHMLEHLKEDVARQGIELEAYFKMIDKDRDTYIEEEVKPAAKKRLERSLVMEKLAQAENVKLEENDYQEAVNETIQALQTLPQPKNKKDRLNQNMVDSMTMNVLNRKFNTLVLDRLKAIATGEAVLAEQAQALAEKVAETTEADAESATSETQPAVDEVPAEKAVSEETPAEPVKTRKPRKKAKSTTEDSPEPEA